MCDCVFVFFDSCLCGFARERVCACVCECVYISVCECVCARVRVCERESAKKCVCACLCECVKCMVRTGKTAQQPNGNTDSTVVFEHAHTSRVEVT